MGRSIPIPRWKKTCRFEGSQFLLADERIRLIFLHGAHWVNCAHEYVITSADAYDYDPQTKYATFFIGVPIRNCGDEAGTADHDHDNRLYLVGHPLPFKFLVFLAILPFSK